MRAVRLAWHELQRFRGARLQWVPAALVLLPLAATLLCWAPLTNPEGRFDQVPAAIVNLDQEATVPSATGKGTTTIQAGQRLSDEVTTRRAFAWRRLDREQAIEQLRDSRIHFALVIPENFSARVAEEVKGGAASSVTLNLLLDDTDGYLMGTAAQAWVGSLREQVATLILDYMTRQTTDVWKDVRSGLDKALDSDAAGAEGREPKDTAVSPNATSDVDKLADSLGQAATSISQVNDIVQTGKSNSGTMASQLNSAAAAAQSAQDNSAGTNAALTQQSAGQANTSVRIAQDSVTGLDDQLQTAATTTKSLLDRIKTDSQTAQALSKETKELREQLQHIAQQLPPTPADDASRASGQLVSVRQQNLHPVKTLGRGLAPLALSLGSCLAVLLALGVLQPVNRTALTSTVNTFTIARAGWMPVAAVTILVSGGLFICAEVLMDIGAVSPWSTFGLCLLVGLCFASVGHLFKVVLGIAGEALIVLLTVLQFGASGGLYPVQTTNSLFINLHPYLPMTYAVEGLRITIGGGHAALALRDAVILAGLAVVCLIVCSLSLIRKRQWNGKRLSDPSRQRFE